MLTKRMISIILSCTLVITSCFNVFAVQAEEEAETFYTFEELLPMTEKEICALSADCESGYTVGKKFITGSLWTDPEVTGYGMELTIYVSDDSPYARISDNGKDDISLIALRSGLEIPESLVTSYYDITDFSNLGHDDFPSGYNLYVRNLEYKGYSFVHVFSTLFAALKNDPNIRDAQPLCSPSYLLPQDVEYINKDGETVVANACTTIAVYARAAANITCTEEELQNADVNGDGTVDLSDAMEILTSYAEYAAGITE